MPFVHEDSLSLGISFDKEYVVVHEFKRPFAHLPQMRDWGNDGSWQEVARFSIEADWYTSKYSKMLQSEYIEEMILWHFIDQRVDVQ